MDAIIGLFTTNWCFWNCGGPYKFKRNDGGDSYSVGVLKSTDGGTTWNTTGLTFTTTNRTAGDIIMHPTNNSILFCAASNALYKTTDGGTTWNVVRLGNFAKGSIRFKPNDPSVVYAVTNTTFYKSTDTGSSFTQITSGLPASSSRLRLDVTPANANYVYILSHSSSVSTNNGFQGVYRSVNSGDTFTLRNNTTNVLESNQSYYDLALAVSDTNAEEVYTGCLNIWKSTNGGTTFTKLNNWSSPTAATYTHADIHFLKFYNGNFFCGSDGGVYKSTNSGTNFTDLTATAQISQFYRIAVSKQSSANMVGGLQDNGGHAYSSGGWKNYYFCSIDLRTMDLLHQNSENTYRNIYITYQNSDSYVNQSGDTIKIGLGGDGDATANPFDGYCVFK